jgi:hypothetical protein
VNDPAPKKDPSRAGTARLSSDARMASCMECGGAVDPAFAVPGYCFVCSVHVASCCADAVDHGA